MQQTLQRESISSNFPACVRFRLLLFADVRYCSDRRQKYLWTRGRLRRAWRWLRATG